MKKLMKFIERATMDYIKANPNKIIDLAVEFLEKNKENYIKSANAKVDLPILNERREAELLEAMYEITIDFFKGMKK